MSMFECQDCGKQGAETTEFKIVKYKNIGMVHCNDCANALMERL